MTLRTMKLRTLIALGALLLASAAVSFGQVIYTGPSFAAGGDLSGSPTSQHVEGFNGVPFCTGFTPTNGQVLEYTTGSSPNPCWEAATGAGGGPGTGTADYLAYWATSSTLGSLGSAITGQIPVFQNGGVPLALSPGLQDSANSPVSTSGYTLACDSASTIIDRGHAVHFTSGASAPVIPLSTAGGCSGGFVATVYNDTGSTLTFGRSGSDTFTIYNGASITTGATSYGLAANAWMTVNQGASGVWTFRVGNTSSGSGGDTITSPNSTLSVGGTSTNTTLDFNLAHSNTWTAQQTESDGSTFYAALSNPSGTPTGTPSGSGGTVAAGSNYAKIIALDSAGRQTAAGTESALVTTTGTTSSIAWAWTAVTGASSYQIWVGSSSGGENYFYTSSTNSYTQTTPITSGSQAGFLTTSNSTGGPYLTGSSTGTVAVPGGSVSSPGLCSAGFFNGICLYWTATNNTVLAWRDTTGSGNQVTGGLDDEGIRIGKTGAIRYSSQGIDGSFTFNNGGLTTDNTNTGTLSICGNGSSSDPCNSNDHGGNLKLTNLTSYGEIFTAASTTANAGLNLPQGSAPTSPANGDLWTTSSGLYARIAGSTVGPFGAGGGTVTSIVFSSPLTGGTVTTTGTVGCATCVTSAASLTSTAIMTGAGSQGSQTPDATATLSSGGVLAGVSLAESLITGSAAQTTITETATGHEITRAGVETANLTYPYVFTNANTTTTTSGALGINTTGSGGTGQVPLIVNETVAAGDFADFYTLGTFTNGVFSTSGATKEFSFGASGNFTAAGTGTFGSSGGTPVVTFSGATSGTATLTGPAVAGTTTNPLVSSNALQAPYYQTATNCSSSASPAVCSAAAAGSVVVAAAASTVVVDTTAVTANSQIIVTEDSSLGTKLGVTCNTNLFTYAVTARTAATSFTITLGSAPSTNPACLSYTVIN